MGALCKLTPTHLKAGILRNPSERDNVDTIQSHLLIYFTGVTHRWKRYPASSCCWVETNHVSHTLLHVYIYLLAEGLLWNERNFKTLKPWQMWRANSLLTSHTCTEMSQNLYRDPDIKSRRAIQTLTISDANSGRKSQVPVSTVFSMQACL